MTTPSGSRPPKAGARSVEIVVPFLNEEENLPLLIKRLESALAYTEINWSVLLVDDGSTDGSAQWALEAAQKGPRIRLLRLSRNFGHQLAITAGMDHSRADAVVIMDADLQDPPEVVPKLVAQWLSGSDVVYAVRASRDGESISKRVLAAAFYRIFRRLAKLNAPPDAGDFRLLDKRVVAVLREVREAHRYVRGLTSWVGFRQSSVTYERAARHAGHTKYPLLKSLRLAFDAITSFTGAPLRWMLIFGLCVSLAGFLLALRIVVAALTEPNSLQPGWASLAALVLILSGTQILCVGLLGQYTSRIFEEVKKRPLYVVSDLVEARAPSPSTEP